MNVDTKLQIAWHLYGEDIKPKVIAAKIEVHQATIYRWIKSFRYLGLRRTIQKYKEAKKGRRRKRKTQVEVKLKVYDIRDKYHDCCGEKIKYYLYRDYGITISVTTIYRILRKKYYLSSRYKKYKRYGETPKGTVDREVLQTDTVDFGDVFAFTYVDTYTRQAYVNLQLDLESVSGKRSLIEAAEIFGKIKLLQSDGGSEFKKEFTETVLQYADHHRISRPYKKNEQSFIESFNRTLRKECLGWKRYKRKEYDNMKKEVEKFLYFYNNERPHLGLQMRIPNEVAICRI